jgi:hypothetical protein
VNSSAASRIMRSERTSRTHSMWRAMLPGVLGSRNR